MDKLVRTLVSLMTLFLLVACNGATSESNSTIEQTPNSIKLSLSSTNQNSTEAHSFSTTDTITINAQLLDSFNKPINNKVVNFNTTLGSLSKDTGLTNNLGIATSEVTGDAILGGGTINVSFGILSADINFEFTAPEIIPIKQPTLSVKLSTNNTTVTRFNATKSVQVSAIAIAADGQPLINEIITFSAERGLLSPTSALTNDAGIAVVNLITTDLDIGAGVVTASLTYNDESYISASNYEIQLNTPSESELFKLGHFNASGEFIEGKLGLTLTPDANGNYNLSAGGTAGLQLSIVNSANLRLLTPTEITFSSNCVDSSKAVINTTVLTINGTANATFEDLSCAGSAGVTDVIMATANIHNTVETITQTINVLGEQVGSIEFVSASPTSLVLKGTGGVNKAEQSTLTFKVKGNLGNPLSQQKVEFSLNSTLGGLTLSHSQSTTNSDGLVSTRVNSGNVPMVVRVTAKTTNQQNQTVSTQSDLLTINTGMPDQNSMTISAASHNLETGQKNGVTNQITARLGDAFNNPVPDGTTVNFTTEGGTIEPSCVTTNGACSVTWTSSEPRVENNRITILATAEGHETFYDTNGNNVFDIADGTALVDTVKAASGLTRAVAKLSGFEDFSEAWRDDDEDLAYDSGEIFIDFNSDNKFNGADGKFNGPQCSGSLCASQKTYTVRKALVHIMSSSNARFALLDNKKFSSSNNATPHIKSRWAYIDNDANVFPQGGSIEIAEESEISLALTFADTSSGFGQTLAAGTTISVSSDVGQLSGTTSYTVPDSIGTSNPSTYGGQEIKFSIKNTNDPLVVGDKDVTGNISFTITSPSGVVTSDGYPLTIKGN